MNYVAQLLPDLEEAHVLRDALRDYIDNPDIPEENRDIAWKLISKLMIDMQRTKKQWP